jgi:O-antigen/teichoic acid export membrane protein
MRLSLLAAALPVVAVAVAWNPLTERLFHGHSALTAALAVGIAGYGLSLFVRGVMGGLRWFGGYGILLLADGAIRLALVLPLAVVAAPWVAAVAVAGAALGGALAPLAAHGWAARRHLRAPGAARFELGHALAFAAPVAVIAAADQLLISGGPLLVVLAGGTGAVTAAGKVFAATMLVRAPAFLFQGFAAALLPSLTTLEAVGDSARFRRSVSAVAAVLAAFSAACAACALLAGPAAMKLLYGPGFDAAPGDLALLALGIGGYLAASTFSQAALARAAAGRAAAIWTVAAVAFVGVELSLGGAPLHRVSVAFAAGTAISALLLFALVIRRPHPLRAPTTLEPVGATQVSA